MGGKGYLVRFIRNKSVEQTLLNLTKILNIEASLVAQMVKNPPAMWETWVWSLDWKIPWRREQLPTPVFWPGEFHGQRSLEGYRPWGPERHNLATKLPPPPPELLCPVCSPLGLNVKGFVPLEADGFYTLSPKYRQARSWDRIRSMTTEGR